MNGVSITLEQGAFLVKDNINEFSDGFFNFLTDPDVLYGGIEEDENKIEGFLLDIRYDLEKGDKIRSRYRTIECILEDKKKNYGRGLTKDKLDNQSCNFADSLIERLELLILEPKTGHDGLYDEMLNVSKQILSMNISNQEQRNIFVFNNGK